jgi:WD40 repeat protein
MDISQDTGQAAFHQQGGDLRVLDMASGIIRTNVLGAAPFDQVRFLGNGQFLFTFRDPSGVGETERTVQVWDARTWRPTGAFSYQNIKRGIAPLGPTFSRANVFAVDSEGKLLVRDFTQPAAPPKMLALPGESDSESAFSAFAVSPDGRLAAAGQENGALSFWNLKTSEFLRTLGEYRGLVASLVFSPDGTRLITTHESGGQIRLWDLESGQELLTLPVQGVNFDTVFSPDGRVLAAFDVTGHLYLWSAPSWDEIAAAEAKETAEVKQP